MKKIAILRFLCAGFLFATLTGCATGYHSVNNPLLGWMGGFWDKKAPGELIEVGFNGNGLIEKDRVGIYLLYRCAELTREKQKNYFTMYESIYDAIVERPLSQSYVGSLGYKPNGHVYLLLQDEQVITQAGKTANAFSATEVMEKYKNQIKVI